MHGTQSGDATGKSAHLVSGITTALIAFQDVPLVAVPALGISLLLCLQAVPLFHFYKDGQLVEAFNTRDKQRILDTINNHLDGDVLDYVQDV